MRSVPKSRGRLGLVLTMALMVLPGFGGCDVYRATYSHDDMGNAQVLLAAALSGDMQALEQLKKAADTPRANSPGFNWHAAALGYALQNQAVNRDYRRLKHALEAYDKAGDTNVHVLYNKALVQLALGQALALQTFEKSASLGLTKAKLQAARLILASKSPDPTSNQRALTLLESATSEADLASQVLLGQTLLVGTLGIAKDSVRGIYLLEQAAQLGSQQAALTLSSVFGRGLFGVSLQPEQAAQWLLVASYGSEEITASAERYFAGLNTLQRTKVQQSVEIFRRTLPVLVGAPDLSSPLPIFAP